MEKSSGKKLNIWKLLIMLACTGVMLGSVLVTVRYTCMMQHVSPSDGRFFAGNSLWLSLLKLLASLISMDVITFCHKVWPWLFVCVMVIEYFFLGLCLFSGDGMSRMYSYSLACIFVSLFMIILHVGYFSESSLEAMVYLSSWQETAVVGILLFPLLVIVLLWKKSLAFKVPFLLMISSLYMGISGMEKWKSLILKGASGDFFEKGWLLILAVTGVTTLILMKKRAARLIVIAVLLSTITLTPYPMGILAAYSVSGLIAQIYIKSTREGTKKAYLTGCLLTAVSYSVLAVTVLAAGLFSGSRVSWNVGFYQPENDIRIPKDLMAVTDYIMENAEGEPEICGSDVAASAVIQYGISQGRYFKNVRGLWHEGPMEITKIKKKINNIDDKSYVIIRNSNSEADSCIESGDIYLIKEFGEYGLYGG